MNDLPPDLKHLISRAQPTPPAMVDRERVWALLRAKGVDPTSPRPRSRLRLLGALGGALALVLFALNLRPKTDGQPGDPPPMVPAPASEVAPPLEAEPELPAPLAAQVPPAPPPVVRLPPASPPPARRQPAPLPSPVPVSVSPEPPAPVVTPPNSLQEELKLLQRAQKALTGSEPGPALETLEEHAARFPEGALKEERMAARVMALCGLGRVEDARAEARKLSDEAPGSPYAERIRGSCAQK